MRSGRRDLARLLLPLSLALVALWPRASAAGVRIYNCFNAFISLDGRYVSLEPDCSRNALIDLSTGKRVKGKVAIGDVAPLPLVSKPRRLGRWLNREWSWQMSLFHRHSYELPNGWLLSFVSKEKNDGDLEARWRYYGRLQYGPRSAFEAMYKKRRNRLPKHGQSLPPVKALAAKKVADMTSVVSASAKSKWRSRGSYVMLRTLTYDPAAYKRLVPTVYDLLRHGATRWHEDGGFEVDSKPRGLWRAIGASDKDGRLKAINGKHGVFLHSRLHRLLSAGKRATIQQSGASMHYKTILRPKKTK